MSRRGTPAPVESNDGPHRSHGPADVESVRRGARQVASGNGQPAPVRTGDGRQGGPAVVGLAGLALSSRGQTAHRLIAASDAERDRIGKDLHDGAQQRLTALRIRLALAAEDFTVRGDTDASAVLTQFGAEVEEAIDELRELVQGVYPALLSSGGLSAALASAGRRSARVTLRASGIGRYASGIETAVYFTCLAAIDNAARHAGPSEVTVRVWDQADRLCFTIRDSGPGFDPQQATAGAGLANMHDRIAAVGGSLTIDSSLTHGTVVEGSVPCAASLRAAAAGARD